MATFAPIQAKITGQTAAPLDASAGGDKIKANDRAAVLYANTGGGSITITVAVPGNTEFGQAEPDVAIVIAAGTTKLVGPFSAELADPTDRLVHITYSGVTGLKATPIAV